MKIPNPKNYDLLWLDNKSYFKITYWLHREFLKRDFLIISKGDVCKTYVSEKERNRLSHLGSKFIKTGFKSYKNSVKNKILESCKFYKKIRGKKLFLLTDRQLSEDFLKTINFFHGVMKLYFFTENFLYDEIQKKIEGDPKRYKNLLKKIEEMQEIKLRFREVALNQTMFKGNIFENYLKEIKKRTKRIDLDFLHYQEMMSLLRGKKIKKENRQNYVLGKFNNWKTITGKPALKIIDNFNRFLLKMVKSGQLKGQIANRGFYKGIVKIIPFDVKKNISGHISKMKQGNILVTGSTGPEMIIACKKAGAIITEQGGITSHAAIISRELNIPCIIDTKIATQVLKDGDLVEVDANKGVVKILKKR